MQLTIKYFGKLTDITKCSAEYLEVQNNTSFENIISLLHEKYPELKTSLHSQFLNNKKIESKDLTLNQNDEIVLMPPFSGG